MKTFANRMVSIGAELLGLTGVAALGCGILFGFWLLFAGGAYGAELVNLPRFLGHGVVLLGLVLCGAGTKCSFASSYKSVERLTPIGYAGVALSLMSLIVGLYWFFHFHDGVWECTLWLALLPAGFVL